MKATVEPLEDNKVKVSVEVDEAEIEQALDGAFRRLAREVRIPGFRPGKAPRKVLEAHLGPQVGREEALRTALPRYYAEAVRLHEVDVIASPEIDITDGQDAGRLAFDAVVEVRPTITLSGYEKLQVTVSSPAPTEAEVSEQLEQLRRRFGELETVDRAAGEGDYVRIDISGTQDGEALDGLTADDYLYEVGSVAVIPEMDEHLRGSKPGEILEFDGAHPEEGEAPLHLRVLVKEVQARVVPELDDAFAREASEFGTLEELRNDIEERMAAMKLERSRAMLQTGLSEALADLVEVEPPEALVMMHVQDHLRNLTLQLGDQGMQFLQQYAEASGKSPEEISAEFTESGKVAAKVDLALRAVADAEDLVMTDEALEAELAGMAESVGQDPSQVRAELERVGQISAVRSDLKKRAAFEWLLERAEVVDEDGEPLDRALLEVRSGPVEDSPDEDSSEADHHHESEESE